MPNSRVWQRVMGQDTLARSPEARPPQTSINIPSHGAKAPYIFVTDAHTILTRGAQGHYAQIRVCGHEQNQAEGGVGRLTTVEAFSSYNNF